MTPSTVQSHLDAIAALALEELPLGPDSHRQAGVPTGTLSMHSHASAIFPGTQRSYWVYVPAQYQAGTASPYMVFQDGQGYCSEDGEMRTTIVLDNLIHRGELPPIIGIFINPGEIPAAGAGEKPVSNRSFEYDTLSDDYVRMVENEILPVVATSYSLSDRAQDHAICGCSSGGICAFNAAWQRPELFSKVLSHVGSFADIRGGHQVPSLVRKTLPRKKIRVFLQGSTNDLDCDWGNWWLANLQMHSALKYAGYDVTTAWDAGKHSGKNGGATLPDALRWLWRA